MRWGRLLAGSLVPGSLALLRVRSMTAPLAAQRAPPGLPSLRSPRLGTWGHTLCGIPPLGKFLASVVWTYCPLWGDSSHISSISPEASRVKLEPSIDKVQGDCVGSLRLPTLSRLSFFSLVEAPTCSEWVQPSVSSPSHRPS